MNRIITWYTGLTNTVKPIVLFIATVATSFIIFIIVFLQMGSKINDLMQPYHASDTIVTKQIRSFQKPQYLTEGDFKVLQLEHDVLLTRKKHHYELAVIFFRNYYGVLVVTMIFSCIGGAVLFMLINKGWATAGITLQALFISIVVTLTFYGFFPLVFQQEKNLRDNLASYLDYSRAEANMLSQLIYLNNPVFANVTVKDTVTKKVEIKFDAAKYQHGADSVMNYNVTRINSLMNYVLAIDAKEIKSVSDIANLLSTYQQSGKDSAR